MAVAGFCWGGSRAFHFATARPDLKAAFVFYGRGPEDEDVMAQIGCPVYGFYGGADRRVNATLPATFARMQEALKFYERVIYEGAGHGFMRAGEAADAGQADRKARTQGWDRWLGLLAKISEAL